MHVLAVVLRSGEEPPLSRAQLQRVMYAHRAHKQYTKYQESLADSDDDEGPQDEEAWLFEDLSLLAKLYARLKDREQLIELIFEVCPSTKQLRLHIHCLAGHDRRPAERYNNNLLCASRTGISCS